MPGRVSTISDWRTGNAYSQYAISMLMPFVILEGFYPTTTNATTAILVHLDETLPVEELLGPIVKVLIMRGALLELSPHAPGLLPSMTTVGFVVERIHANSPLVWLIKKPALDLCSRNYNKYILNRKRTRTALVRKSVFCWSSI